MLHCNCSFNICVASFIIHTQHVKEEWMQTWKIRISWNIKQNSISGAFVFWLYNSIPHFISSGSFSTTFEWMDIAQNCWWKGSYPKKTTAVLHTQQTLKWIFPLRFSFARSWKCQVQGIGTLEKNGCWLFVWFTRRDRLISSESMCCTNFFRLCQLFYRECFRLFKFSTFFNLFQLFFLVLSTFFNFVLKL